MKKINVCFLGYRNLGCVASGKSFVFTAEYIDPTADFAEKIVLFVPFGWELFRNADDELMVCSPSNRRFLVDEILDGNEEPCFRFWEEDYSYFTRITLEYAILF